MKTETEYFVMSLFLNELKSVIDFPEKAGVIIDHAKEAGHYSVALELIEHCRNYYGFDMYADYKAGKFEFTPEYKAARNLTDAEIDRMNPEEIFQHHGLTPVVAVVDNEVKATVVESMESLKSSCFVSECCWSPARGGEDYGICPDCGEHCQFVDMSRPEQEIDLAVPTSPLNYSAKTAIAEKIEEEKLKTAEAFKNAIAHSNKMIGRQTA